MRIKCNRRASEKKRSSNFANARMRARSFLITPAIPGRMTLTTTSSPLVRVASCTCASDAEARGCSEKVAKESVTGRPISVSILAIAIALGNGGTRSWRRASSSAYSSGNKSRRVERSCPNLMNTGPRRSIASLHRFASEVWGVGSNDVGNRCRVQWSICNACGIVSSRNRSAVARICTPRRSGINSLLPL